MGARTRFCPRGHDKEETGRQQVYRCAECRRSYNKSEKGRSAKRRYERSEKGRSARRRYDKSEQGKATDRRYRNTEKGQRASARHEYQRTKTQLVQRIERKANRVLALEEELKELMGVQED